jgi:preprotein translocase subunit SecA
MSESLGGTKMTTKTKLDVKFGLYKISKGSESVKVWYTIEDDYVRINESDYDRLIGSFFPQETYINNSDSMTDYFEKSSVILRPESKNYAEIRKQIIEINNKLKAKREAQYQKRIDKCRLNNK